YQRRTANAWVTSAGRPPLFNDLPLNAAAGRGWNPDIVVTPARARELVLETVREAQTPYVSISWWAIPPGVAPAAAQRSLELFAGAVLAPGMLTDQAAPA